MSNLFKLDRLINFQLFQYIVNFCPEVPSKGMRRSMLQEHLELLGGIFMFDGLILFLPIQLENEVLFTSNLQSFNQLIGYST
jgi:hypothetical protein